MTFNTLMVKNLPPPTSPHIKYLDTQYIGLGAYVYLYLVCGTQKIEIIQNNLKPNTNLLILSDKQIFDVCLPNANADMGSEVIRSFKSFKKALKFIETKYVPNSVKFIQKL